MAIRIVLLAVLLAACGASGADDGHRGTGSVPAAADSALRPVSLAPPADSAARVDGTCLPYEPETVTITGRLEHRMFYGPPGYGENPAEEHPEPGFYLVPDAPICTRAAMGAGNGAKQDIRLVQMVLDQPGYARARPYLDTRVRATGSLFAWITGHHHAELLLNVDSIVPADGSR